MHLSSLQHPDGRLERVLAVANQKVNVIKPMDGDVMTTALNYCRNAAEKDRHIKDNFVLRAVSLV